MKTMRDLTDGRDILAFAECEEKFRRGIAAILSSMGVYQLIDNDQEFLFQHCQLLAKFANSFVKKMEYEISELKTDDELTELFLELVMKEGNARTNSINITDLINYIVQGLPISHSDNCDCPDAPHNQDPFKGLEDQEFNSL